MRATTRPSPPNQGLVSKQDTALSRIGGWCFDHRIAAVGIWLVGLAVVLGAAGVIGPAYDAVLDLPDSDSADGFTVLEENFAELGAGTQSGTIVFRADQGVADPEVRAAMEELFALVDAGFPGKEGVPEHPGATVISPYSEQGAGQVATEGPLAGKLAYAQVNLAPDVDLTESARIGEAIAERAPAIDGLEVLPGGTALAPYEPPESELIGLAFAIVVLVLAFGSVLATGLPVAVALGGVGAGVAATLLLSNVYAIPDFALSVGVMIGLGVGIDYALFIVTRYRQGTHAGMPPRAATRAAMGTAGRAVIFAGITVVISLLGMLLMGIPLVTGVGLGASVTVLLTMISSLTLLPALLGLAGERIEVTRWRGLLGAGFIAAALLGAGIGFPPLAAGGAILAAATLLVSVAVRPLRRPVPRRRAKPVRDAAAHRWSRTIQRRPWLWVAVGTVALLTLASPILGLRLGVADESNHPEGTYTRRAYDLLAGGFGEGFNGPLLITVVPRAGAGAGGTAGAVQALRQSLAATPGVAAVTEPLPDDATAPKAFLMTAIPTTAPQAEATSGLVTRLRDAVIPAAVGGTGLDVKVTGTTAANIDLTNFLGRRVLLFLGVVLSLSFVLLLVVFRSLLVPLKAVIMNVLAITATYGVVVAVFQWGWGGDLLDIAGAPIEPFIPMVLFAIVFGLSMDYEVFLLSRIREEYARTNDAVESVADGLAATARVITAAAAIMVVVFGSFVLEDDRVLRMFGLGMAVAVLLDATLVRMLLVPATMALLGARNWWMPGWLDRLLPHLGAEGTGVRAGAVHDDAPPCDEAETSGPAQAPPPVPRPQPVDA
ncbi:MAG TPA: MMPL family transporter [Acidimicrobiales bacterium]|nr:MMPL family transporter [Acidimicrobiales bacterium]